MPTLLLKLVAPMQSWGVQSNFTHRDTGFEPSKSGVIGLICAALGRDRAEPVDDLAALKMGVRVDRQGVVLKDYHTAGKVRVDSCVRRAMLSATEQFCLTASTSPTPLFWWGLRARIKTVRYCNTFSSACSIPCGRCS